MHIVSSEHLGAMMEHVWDLFGGVASSNSIFLPTPAPGAYTAVSSVWFCLDHKLNQDPGPEQIRKASSFFLTG